MSAGNGEAPDSGPDWARKRYDVAIVGAGVAGAILAKELANAGHKVLLLEAGRATSIRPEGYASYVETYQTALAKVPNSPYPPNPNAPSMSVLSMAPVRDGVPVAGGYPVFRGPMPFLSNYTRTLGGTTLHFLGTCIRMVPSDFQMSSLYGRGVDWPISYESLSSFYERAELEMGVAADVEEGEREGVVFRKGYQYPMRQIPKTYLDRWLDKKLQGLRVPMGPDELPVEVVGTPAGRNGMPNPDYIDPRTGEPYQPRGAPYDDRTGQRCEGNSACVPICPVMAKYNALRSLYSLEPKKSRNLKIVTQVVAHKVELDRDKKLVTGISCKMYDDESLPNSTPVTVRARRYVIAAHSIETAKILLASGAANRSDMVGRNLMDHPYMLTWGLAPKKARLGVFRGPQITSEIPMRDGRFRGEFAAFRVDIRNGGWDFCTGAPYTNVAQLVGKEGMYGKKLRDRLHSDVQRQIGFGFQIEQLPDRRNRVEIREEYKDQLGNHRPVITYDIDDYTRRAMRASKDLHDAVMRKVGGKDYTEYSAESAGSLLVDGETFSVNGAGHIVGTHRMGAKPETSVVDTDQRTWDHQNLFLVGCGNMPTIGTSNPTLTMAALAFKAVDCIKGDLNRSDS